MAKKVLVVDDTISIRDVLPQQLVACGVESKACVSLEETIEIIQDWQPDVVMLDLLMPASDGFEIIEQIHLQFPNPPKVVAVSGEVSNTTQERVKKAGFTEFLQKPFRLPQIKAVLKNLFPEE